MTTRELKIRIKSPMLSIKNGLITETHSVFPPGEGSETVEYGVKAMANNIACTISPFSLIGWLRKGITEYLISQGISVCHSFDLTNVSKSNTEYINYANQDLNHGYHKKRMGKGDSKERPECEAVTGKQCMVYQMFGGFTGHHRVFSIMPVKITPIQTHYDKAIKNITGKGNYRNLAISPRSHVDGTPLSTHNADVIANLDAILYLKLYNSGSNDLYTAMIMRGVEHLSKHTDDFEHQLGGARTFGCGFIEPTFLSPELTREEVTKYHNLLIKQEDAAEDNDGLSKTISEKLSRWQDRQKELNEILNAELKTQKDLFGIDKKWWNREL